MKLKFLCIGLTLICGLNLKASNPVGGSKMSVNFENLTDEGRQPDAGWSLWIKLQIDTKHGDAPGLRAAAAKIGAARNNCRLEALADSAAQVTLNNPSLSKPIAEDFLILSNRTAQDKPYIYVKPVKLADNKYTKFGSSSNGKAYAEYPTLGDPGWKYKILLFSKEEAQQIHTNFDKYFGSYFGSENYQSREYGDTKTQPMKMTINTKQTTVGWIWALDPRMNWQKPRSELNFAATPSEGSNTEKRYPFLVIYKA